MTQGSRERDKRIDRGRPLRDKQGDQVRVSPGCARCVPGSRAGIGLRRRTSRAVVSPGNAARAVLRAPTRVGGQVEHGSEWLGADRKSTSWTIPMVAGAAVMPWLVQLPERRLVSQPSTARRKSAGGSRAGRVEDPDHKSLGERVAKPIISVRARTLASRRVDSNSARKR